MEPCCTAAAAPGLASDSAWARSAGAARISNPPTAAKPRSLITFMFFSPLGSSGVTPAAWLIESSRAAAPIASYVDDVNVK